MAAKDKYHNQVRHALEKDGWVITHDPYFLKLEGVNYPVDLGAEKIYHTIQKIPILLKALNRFQVKVVIFDPNLEEVKLWLRN